MNVLWHCPRCDVLERENKELKLQLKELRDKYFGRKKKQKKEECEAKKNPKKKGAPYGHPGWSRPKPDHIDEVEVIIPCRCGVCGSAELEETTIADEEHIQEDICLPKRMVKKFVRKVMRCKKCHSLVRGGRGKDEMPNSYIGPVAKAWANHLRYEIGIPQHKIRMVFTELFDMPMVQASVCGFENQLTIKSDKFYGEIKHAVINAPSRYADETGWKEDGQRRQLWCICTREAAFFHIDQSRGSKVIISLLGASRGVTVSDFYSAYNILKGPQQKCHPHLLRIIKRKELRFLGEDNEADAFLEEMKILSLRVMELFRRRKSIKDYMIQRADVVSMIRRRLAEPLEHKPLEKWRKQMGKYAKQLTTCLFHPISDSNNNFVERMLRLSVIMRKITFGNRSLKGIKNHQVIMSMTQTCKLNGQLPADIFYQLLLDPAKVSMSSVLATSSNKITPRPPPSLN